MGTSDFGSQNPITVSFVSISVEGERSCLNGTPSDFENQNQHYNTDYLLPGNYWNTSMASNIHETKIQPLASEQEH